MVLSDRDIRAAVASGKITFEPTLLPEQVGPASVDLRLGDTFLVFRSGRHVEIDPKKGLPPDYMEKIVLQDQPFVLHPNKFVLASTREYFNVPDDMVVLVEGKSSLARMGLLVHTAGLVNPGDELELTLEISNHADLPVLLHPGMYICQIMFLQLSSVSERPYYKQASGVYLKAKGPAPAQVKHLFSS